MAVYRRNAGSLHCATHDEAVSSFGRDDASLAWVKRQATTTHERQGSFAALRMTTVRGDGCSWRWMFVTTDVRDNGQRSETLGLLSGGAVCALGWKGVWSLGDDDPGDEVDENSGAAGEEADQRGDDADEVEVPAVVLREASTDSSDHAVVA